jgi:C-terminal processing protease CtpA/Prc
LGGAGAGGETTGQIGRVTELKIGNYKIKSPITLFSQDKAGAFATDQLAGNIGARVANKFRVFLDYDRKRIIFEPNSTFALPYDHAQSGMSMVAEGGDYRVFRIRAVLENSPASEAGLQKDDIITSVNNQTATELTLSILNELFEHPVPYKLTIRRGDQTLQLTLTPRRLV